MIIAIHGEIGAGKNTVIDILKDIYNEKNITYDEFAFADKLKEVVSIIGNFDIKLAYTQEGKNTYIETFDTTIGEMLQDIGESLRQYNEYLWIIDVLQKIKKSNKDIIFITDLRYKNELYSLQKLETHHKFVTITVKRDVNPINTNTTRNTKHISEIQLNNHKFDYIINNNSDLYQLHADIKILFDKINI